MTTSPTGEMTASSRYKQLEAVREPYLIRAREMSKYSLPRLYPEIGTGPSTVYYKPWQSIVGQFVSGFASKLTLSLLPPNRSPCRLRPTPKAKAHLEETDAASEGKTDVTGEVDVGLSRIETSIRTEIERVGHRRVLTQAMQHLQVSGNCAVDLGNPDPKVYSLDQFVCVRDREGTVVELIIKERVGRSTLSMDLQRMIGEQSLSNKQSGEQTEEIDVYTWVWLEDGNWKVCQEINDKEVPKSRGQYPKDSPRFLAIRWGRVDGEDYARSLLEDNSGDISAVESLQRSITQYALASSRLIYLVRPGGMTDIDDIAEAASGDFIPGTAEDVQVPVINKQYDLAVAQQNLAAIVQRLSIVFLQTANLRRDAERVTAEEIRFLAAEIDTANSGIYSTLSHEYQLPLVKWTMFRMKRERNLPPMPEGTVELTIIGGVDALGRNADLQAIEDFVKGTQELLGPSGLQSIKVGNVNRRRAAALGLDPKELVFSDAEIAAQQNQMQQASLMQKAAPQMISSVADVAVASAGK